MVGGNYHRNLTGQLNKAADAAFFVLRSECKFKQFLLATKQLCLYNCLEDDTDETYA
jgi:hypothetical protein